LFIEPQKQNNKEYEFYKQNEVDLPKKFSPYKTAGGKSDFNYLDNIAQLYQQKNAILNNPNISTEQKAPEVNALQDQIFSQAFEMSHGVLKDVPSANTLENLAKKYTTHK
jgi:hypothetical protein